MRETVTLVVPEGYASGKEFAKDCGFEIAQQLAAFPLVGELRDQATRLTVSAYSPSEARALRVEWRAADEIERLLGRIAMHEAPRPAQPRS